MATNETTAIINARAGNMGYNGTLNGLVNSGCFLRNTKRDTIEII